MKKYFFKLKKILSNLYNIDQKIKGNLLTIDYEKSILENKNINCLIYKIDEPKQIIVSLTTYNKRIYDVHLTIESLFRQTFMPNKIVLWLADDEFNLESIPLMLKKMQEKGLEIKFCKDLKSYKKLIPALKKYPDDIIITVDDDILYSHDLIENLYKKHLKYSNAVICSRAHKYKINNKRFAPYKDWKIEENNLEKQIFLTSGGGTLFPPKCFDKEVFNEENIFKLAPIADDIWINAMLLKNNIEIKQIDLPQKWSKRNIILEEAQDIALCKMNVNENQNDIQLKAVFDYYNLWEKLKDEE